MMKKAIVSSSGGCDSSTLVSLAVKEFGADNVVTVSISYGQKHLRELKCAEDVANYYNLRHEVLDLSQIFKHSNCSLLSQSTEEIPEGSYAEQIDKSETGVVSTYVPYRNGLMLSSLASFGLSLFPEDEVYIYLGAHADDAAGNAYPDCSKEFTDAIAKAIDIGTDHQVKVVTPLVAMNKAEVVRLGLELGTPYHLTTSCYRGGDKACGSKCGTCIDRVAAFKANGVIDPIPYEGHIDWSGCITVSEFRGESNE